MRGSTTHQLDGFGRLWQGIRIEPGWEDALEAVLRERLNGIALEDLQKAADWLNQPPPGKVSFFQKRSGEAASAAELGGRKPLRDYITCTDAGRGRCPHRLAGPRLSSSADAADGFAERGVCPPARCSCARRATCSRATA